MHKPLSVGRDSKMYVFRLSDLEGDVDMGTRGKTELKEHRLERTRGCTLYATSRPGGSHLRMVSMQSAHQGFSNTEFFQKLTISLSDY